MTSATLVDQLGFAAGAVWMMAAFYFQMVRERGAHPAFVAGLFLIGVALMLSSSAIALRSPRLVGTLAVTANILFIVLGLGIWYGADRHFDVQDRQTASGDDPLAADH